jgi:uncharacterized cupredoxin-like copper-binding protein
LGCPLSRADLARLIAVLAVQPLAVARGQPAADWTKAQQLDVLMVDDRFVPDHLTFRHGVPYRMVLRNSGKDLHEFTAPAFFADTVLRDPSVLAQNQKEVVVQPGTEISVYLMPVKAGTFELVCANHDWDGMVGQIVVE